MSIVAHSHQKYFDLVFIFGFTNNIVYVFFVSSVRLGS
jgi:hypothetical protein